MSTALDERARPMALIDTAERGETGSDGARSRPRGDILLLSVLVYRVSYLGTLESVDVFRELFEKARRNFDCCCFFFFDNAKKTKKKKHLGIQQRFTKKTRKQINILKQNTFVGLGESFDFVEKEDLDEV